MKKTIWISVFAGILAVIVLCILWLNGFFNFYERTMSEGKRLFALGDYEGAALQFEKAHDIDFLKMEPIKYLKEVYENLGNTQAIMNLIIEFDEKNDSAGLMVFTPNLPQLSPKSGRYDSPISVELTSEDGAEIYYTLDNTEPSAQSTKYTGPILMQDEHTTLIAICISKYGIESAFTRADFWIEQKP